MSACVCLLLSSPGTSQLTLGVCVLLLFPLTSPFSDAETLTISKKAFRIRLYFSSGPCQSAFGSSEQAKYVPLLKIMGGLEIRPEVGWETVGLSDSCLT